MKENKKDFRQFICSPIGKYIMIAFMYVLFFGIFGMITILMDDMGFLAFIYAALFIYFGWKALNFIQPNVFLIMPIGGWVIYGIIKAILAFFIGIFVAPFSIANIIATKIQSSTNNVE